MNSIDIKYLTFSTNISGRHKVREALKAHPDLNVFSVEHKFCWGSNFLLYSSHESIMIIAKDIGLVWSVAEDDKGILIRPPVHHKKWSAWDIRLS